jgi:hypothetical protein
MFNLELEPGKSNFGELKRCINKLKDLLQNGIERQDTRDIFNSTSLEMAKENLIRSPELIEVLRKETTKYEQIRSKVAELEKLLNSHQDEEKLLEQFIEALYTKTIYKKGAQFVYDHDAEEDAWEPFVSLMKVNKFYEYVMFEAMRVLDSKRLALLQRKASKRGEQMTGAQDISELLGTLKEMAAAYQESKSALDYDRNEYANGEEMYRFYKQVATKVSDILKTLK